MKKYIIVAMVLALAGLVALKCCTGSSCSCTSSSCTGSSSSCTSCSCTDSSCSCPKNVDKPQPINISVVLDLSDRITRPLTPSQMERDTAIVAQLADWFKQQTRGPQILQSTNRMKVFFYPAPAASDIAALAEGLCVDMDELKVADRTPALNNMKSKFRTNLEQIYKQTLGDGKYVGCDIWDFFSSGQVDQHCIKGGARNIVVVITDGYLYHVNNKIKEATAYSYILPQTLAVPGSSLIVKRKGLENLEVLMLEVNPYTPAERDPLVSVLTTWFKEMGVQHLVIAETDLPTNTRTIVRNFLDAPAPASATPTSAE